MIHVTDAYFIPQFVLNRERRVRYLDTVCLSMLLIHSQKLYSKTKQEVPSTLKSFSERQVWVQATGLPDQLHAVLLSC